MLSRKYEPIHQKVVESVDHRKAPKILFIIAVILVAGSAIVVTATVTDFNVQENAGVENNSSTLTQVPTRSENTSTPKKTDFPPSDPTSSISTNLKTTDTATQTETRIPSETKSDEKVVENSTAYQRALYKNFMTIYNSSLDNSSVNVTTYTIDPKNESATIYWTQNPGNRTSHVLNRQSALANYAAFANIIRESNNATAKAVPKRMFFSIHSPEGELYMLTYIDYLDAFKYSEGTMSVFDYQAEYEINAEYGPAHPEYGENQTATAASA